MVDPAAEISVAITLDRLEIDLLGGDRVTGIIKAAIAAAAA
jgi:hypothetical protein